MTMSASGVVYLHWPKCLRESPKGSEKYAFPCLILPLRYFLPQQGLLE